MIIDDFGYLIRGKYKKMRGRYQIIPKNNPKNNWWLVKYIKKGYIGINLGKHYVFLPKNMIGKKVRIRIELVRDFGKVQ